MEYALAELLTREEMLHILRQRQLKMPNLEELSPSELLKVYKTFALPLARRETAPLGRTAHHRRAELKNDNTMPMELDLPSTEIKKNCDVAITFPCDEIKVYALPVSEKRRRNYQTFNPLADEYLSNATKRIKIDWS